MQSTYSADIVIVGGGIAGLWILNRLCNRGYNAVLLESERLGGYQSVASQGMIHGGIKYALGGALTGASEAIADMPDHWRACLRGEGDVDLSGADILSDHFYLWSTAGLTSRFGAFVASKVTRGRVEKVPRDELPAIFAGGDFNGSLYRLVDLVVDAPSVVAALADNCPGRIFKIDRRECVWEDGPQGSKRLRLARADRGIAIDASAFVFAAGKGNGDLLDAVGATAPRMQLRPLQQVMVKHRYPHRFYGHCIGADKTPRLTISSHPMADGSQVWYLGGSLAENGAGQSADDVIARARREIADLMPWVELTDARWAALPVERAEPRQARLARPDSAFAAWADGPANIMAAWPTKLTLSPHLADEVESRLRARGITPGGGAPPALPLGRPDLSPTPWQEAFGNDPA